MSNPNPYPSPYQPPARPSIPGSRRSGPLALICLLGLLGLSAQAAEERNTGRDTGQVMADAMTRMMEAFGFDGSQSPTTTPMTAMTERMPMDPSRAGAWSGMMPGGVPMSSDWPGAFGNPVWEFGIPNDFRRFGPFSGFTNPQTWRPTTLDGIWEGRDGSLLIVRGYRFRLYQLEAGYVDGLIQQRGDRVVLYNPANQQALPYDYAQQRGRLVLRDPRGQLFLYRELWLEQDFSADALGLPSGVQGGRASGEMRALSEEP